MRPTWRHFGSWALPRVKSNAQVMLVELGFSSEPATDYIKMKSDSSHKPTPDDQPSFASQRTNMEVRL